MHDVAGMEPGEGREQPLGHRVGRRPGQRDIGEGAGAELGDQRQLTVQDADVEDPYHDGVVEGGEGPRLVLEGPAEGGVPGELGSDLLDGHGGSRGHVHAVVHDAHGASAEGGDAVVGGGGSSGHGPP